MLIETIKMIESKRAVTQFYKSVSFFLLNEKYNFFCIVHKSIFFGITIEII